MGIEFLADYMIPVIIGLCLAVGYIVKHWVKDVDNKIIPTLCAVLGVVVAFWMNWGSITPEVILSGLASGLASTGLHQAFKQLVGNKEENTEE
jgi:Na+/glutamate symporter